MARLSEVSAAIGNPQWRIDRFARVWGGPYGQGNYRDYTFSDTCRLMIGCRLKATGATSEFIHRALDNFSPEMAECHWLAIEDNGSMAVVQSAQLLEIVSKGNGWVVNMAKIAREVRSKIAA